MGIRFFVAALLAMILGCDVAIGDGAGRELDAGTGGSAGADADAGMDAGADAGADTDADTDVGTDAGTGGSAGSGGSGGSAGAGGTGGSAGTGGGAGSGGNPDPCAGGPLSSPIPNCTPTPVPNSGDIHADCVARINQFRWECQCLPPLTRWVDGERCTDSNAEYDSEHGVHASFSAIPCGSGSRAQNECPGWPSNSYVISNCLQAMWDEGPEDGDPNTVNGHYESMATSTYTRVACGFFTTPSGDVWGVQNFD
jgi:hypothetical protein